MQVWRKCRHFAIPVVALLAAMPFVSCKTSAGSNLRSLADMQEGMTVHGQSAHRELWSVRMGLSFTGDAGALTIGTVQEALFADVIGLKAGDVIQALNGIPVHSAAEFEQVANGYAAQTRGSWDGVWRFSVRRGGTVQQITRPEGYACNPYMLIHCGPLRAGE